MTKTRLPKTTSAETNENLGFMQAEMESQKKSSEKWKTQRSDMSVLPEKLKENKTFQF